MAGSGNELESAAHIAGTEHDVASKGEHEGVASKRRDRPRRFAAGAVAVVGASLVLAGYFVPALQVCQQQLASTGNTGVVEICAPVGLPGLVPIVLLVTALLWPDLSEVTVAGLFSLRRRIEEQAQRQAELEGRLFQIQQATQQATQQTNVLVSTEALAHLPEEAREKAPLVERQGPALEEDVSPSRGEPTAALEAPEAQLGARLLFLWERIAEALALVDDRRGLRGRLIDRSVDAGELNRIIRWRSVYNREIEIVRAARNSVAHPGVGASLSLKDLRSVVSTAEYLLLVLRNESPYQD